jgi:hypothetical protein
MRLTLHVKGHIAMSHPVRGWPFGGARGRSAGIGRELAAAAQGGDASAAAGGLSHRGQRARVAEDVPVEERQGDAGHEPLYRVVSRVRDHVVGSVQVQELGT